MNVLHICTLRLIYTNGPHLKVLTTLALQQYQLVRERASHMHSSPHLHNVPHLKVLTTLALKQYQLVRDSASHVHSSPHLHQCTTPQSPHYSRPKTTSVNS